MKNKTILCPICEKYEFEEYDDYDICDLCGWENDGLQMDKPDYAGGANDESLNEYKEKYQNGQLQWQLEGKSSRFEGEVYDDEDYDEYDDDYDYNDVEDDE